MIIELQDKDGKVVASYEFDDDNLLADSKREAKLLYQIKKPTGAKTVVKV